MWVPAEQSRETARLIGRMKAVLRHARAITCLNAPTGCFDASGGKPIFEAQQVVDKTGNQLMPTSAPERSLGRAEHTLGPEASGGWITTDDFYRAAIDCDPWRVEARINFAALPCRWRAGQQDPRFPGVHGPCRYHSSRQFARGARGAQDGFRGGPEGRGATPVPAPGHRTAWRVTL